MRVLDGLARLCAIAAGALLVLITMMTCASVAGREFIGRPITGDFELAGAAAGAAIALFMPWCQLRRGHIIVDFFTTRAPAATQLRLDRIGALLLSLVMGLMTWRSTLGGLNAWNTQSSTMIMGFPEWVVYAAMVPPLALTALIALVQAIAGFADEASEANPELSA